MSPFLKDNITIFCGASGVGKSSIIKLLANLEKIRDAAYATGIQVSQIGTDNVTKQDFDTSAVSFDSSAATTIDTSNANDFLNSLTANLDVEPVTADDLNIYGDASEALEAKQS